MTAKLLAAFVKDDSGATAIEYALIAGLIALVIIAALTTLGQNLGDKYDEVADEF